LKSNSKTAAAQTGWLVGRSGISYFGAAEARLGVGRA
jgi:hypothetical protein